MDRLQINTSSTVCEQSLVMWAFTNIDGFNEDFLTFFIDVLGDSADIASLQKRLQDIFLQRLNEDLSYSIFSSYCHIHGFDCDFPVDCATREPERWKKALQILKNEIMYKINKDYVSFTFAYENIDIFYDKIMKYMNEFARTRGLRLNSIPYTEHFALLKNGLQCMMDFHIIYDMDMHFMCCMDDGYAYDAEPYFLCKTCMTNLKKEWQNLLDEWIIEQKDINAYHADRSHDFSDNNDDVKEKSHRDFIKKSKGNLRDKERRFRRNGLLTKNVRKELRYKRDMLILTKN